MPSYQRPGVYIQETTNAVNTPPPFSANAVAAFIGDANRGPTQPTLVSNWSQFTTLFGDFTNSTYLAKALYFFFVNGGGNAYVARVAGTGAAVATRTLDDTAATPQPTLAVNAANAGTWGNDIYLDVTAGYTAGRFNLIVKFGGTGQSNVVETFNDLSMSQSDNRYAPSIINSLSNYITVTDENSTTAAPNNAPATQSGTALAGGANGAAGAASDYTTALNSFASINQPLVLNLPGQTTPATITAVQSGVESQANIFLVVDPPENQTVSEVVAFAAGLTPDSYTAVYYPWIQVNDPSKNTPGATTFVPPGGAVVGQIMATDQVAGPYKTPAGVSNRLVGALGLEKPGGVALQPSDYDTLNTSNPPVNGIRNLPGYGICVYGGRTLESGYASKYIAIRRSLIYIEQNLKNLTQFAVFQPNDAKLWAQLISKCDAFLSAYYAQGGLAGSSPSQAYFVVCDASNNTAATIQNGQVNVQVGVALEYPAEYVVINVGQSQNGSSVNTVLS